jgi:hypothetical protein
MDKSTARQLSMRKLTNSQRCTLIYGKTTDSFVSVISKVEEKVDKNKYDECRKKLVKMKTKLAKERPDLTARELLVACTMLFPEKIRREGPYLAKGEQEALNANLALISSTPDLVIY